MNEEVAYAQFDLGRALAVRIAIKYMGIVDDHFAQKKLDAKGEAFCEQMAMKLAQEIMKVAEKSGTLYDT